MAASIAAAVASKSGVDTTIPRIGIITGTGLSAIADIITNKTIVPVADIQGFPRPKVKGHPGRLVFGEICSKPVVCLQGRIHFYENYSFAYIGTLVQILHELGTKILIISNAAGGLNEEFQTGDVMIIKDHINLTGDNALRGIVHPEKGFPFINIHYDLELQNLGIEAAKEIPDFSDSLRSGVYSIINGPTYETVAESKFLAKIGADAAGMSTIPEVQMANYLGIRVFAFSLITNLCPRTYNFHRKLESAPQDQVSEEVYVVGQDRMPSIVKWVTAVINKIHIE